MTSLNLNPQLPTYCSPYYFIEEKEGKAELNFSPAASTINEEEVQFDLFYHRNLHCIQLTLCPISTPTIQTISAYQTQLKELFLQGCQNLTDESLFYLTQSCTQLTVLNLNGCISLTNVGIAQIGNLSSLQVLSLANTITSDISITPIIVQCQGLLQLELDCCPITDVTIGRIAFFGKSLRLLHINFCTQLTNFAMEYIALRQDCIFQHEGISAFEDSRFLRKPHPQLLLDSSSCTSCYSSYHEMGPVQSSPSWEGVPFPTIKDASAFSDGLCCAFPYLNTQIESRQKEPIQKTNDQAPFNLLYLSATPKLEGNKIDFKSLTNDWNLNPTERTVITTSKRPYETITFKVSQQPQDREKKEPQKLLSNFIVRGKKAPTRANYQFLESTF